MRLIFGLMFIAIAGAASADGELTVRGDGGVSVAPDLAIVTFGAEEQAKDASEAMDAVSQTVSAIFQQLESFGIEGRDVQTTDLSLSPVWADRLQGEPRRITGYRASNQVTVRLRDISRTGALLDAVMEDGANQLSGLRFDLADRSQAMAEARRAAVADARAKAELYADAAGVRLGSVSQIIEPQNGGGGYPMMRMAAMESDMPIAAGETTITAQIEITYELED